MSKKRNGARILMLALCVFVIAPLGCKSSGDAGPSMKDIPEYPNAVEGDAMSGSAPGGMVGGGLKQFTTTDSYDEVVDFYNDALSGYAPQVMSHESELGRQTAITIQKEKGVLSVSIQELKEEGKVNITFMEMGG